MFIILPCSNRVMLSHNLFSHTIEDFATMSEMPKSLLAAVAVDKLVNYFTSY
jgi:hypothetical protein